MNLIIEEGMMTSLIKQKVSIHEKLKTLILKGRGCIMIKYSI